MQSFSIFRIFFLILFYTPLFSGETSEKRPTICLNMIVKNESQVITRCLGSVKPMIDYWVIVDTGSTDGTQKIIREFMKEIPGELVERPWVNFAHNRNEALELAQNKGDYVLFIDADEEFSYADSFQVPYLKADFYYISCSYDSHIYRRKLLINNRLDWKWKGVVHELIDCPNAKEGGTVEGVTNVIRMEGYRSRDPDKYKKDVLLLEKAVETDPSFVNLYFLGQSYRDSGDYASAVQVLEKCAPMGGTPEEKYWCIYQVALLQEVMQKDFETIVKGYHKAYQALPARAEPLHELARYLNNHGLYLLSFQLCKFALTIPMPDAKDSCIFNKSIYDYGILMELTRAAYWLNQYSEAYEATLMVLNRKETPDSIRAQAKANLQEISNQWIR